MKNWIIIATVLIIAVTGGSLYLMSQQNRARSDDQTKELLYESINQTNPWLLNKDKPVYKIGSVAKFEEKWYIINISSLSETKQSVPVYFIALETDGVVQIILGPDTHFTESEMLQYNVPDSVMRELL